MDKMPELNYRSFLADAIRDYLDYLDHLEIDLGPALRGPVFEPLHDLAYFKTFTVHPEFHTLVWPNGADFAPEFLHANVRVTA